MTVRYFSLFFWLCLLGSSTLLANHHHHRRAAPAKPTRVAHRYHFTSPLYGQNALTQILNRLIQPNSRSAKIAVYVKSMRHGDILYAHSIYQSLAPASTLKILTAEAALLYLGPNYRFNTQLLTDSGTITNGVLQGNLYVVLSGDPTFTDDNLLELLSALRSKSIHAIAGN
ncbi:MAG: D-alanyl-D-alanine carboxypeptidase, fraction B, penicillin binding protein 4, partial [uncultured bacterium]